MHTPARTSQCWSRQTQHGLGVCIWMHLVNGTGNSLSPGRPSPGVVKQDKSSGGSVDTIKTRSDPQRVRMSSGERPIGAAKGNNQIPRPCARGSEANKKNGCSQVGLHPRAHLIHFHFVPLVMFSNVGGWGCWRSWYAPPPENHNNHPEAIGK